MLETPDDDELISDLGVAETETGLDDTAGEDSLLGDDIADEDLGDDAAGNEDLGEPVLDTDWVFVLDLIGLNLSASSLSLLSCSSCSYLQQPIRY